MGRADDVIELTRGQHGPGFLDKDLRLADLHARADGQLAVVAGAATRDLGQVLDRAKVVRRVLGAEIGVVGEPDLA